jgi:hypothetical protein
MAQFGRVGFLAQAMKDFKVLDVHTPPVHCLSSASRVNSGVQREQQH